MSRDIIGFYRGDERNQVGETIDDIFKMSMNELEKDHCYIQWLFPLPEKSKAVPTAPVLCEADIQDFKSDESLQMKMAKATMKMLSFYGLTINGGDESLIVKGSNWEERSKEWITPRNHNFLRLTRMIRSLKLCGMETWAKALHNRLCKIYEENSGTIGPLTKQFWDEAIEKD